MRIRPNLCCRQIFAPWWTALALAGCATPPTTGPLVVAPARLAVVNLTPYPWAIAVAPAAGGDARLVRIEPRGNADLDLPGGDYRIEQALISTPARPETVRQFPARFDAGQTYRWPLATLSSEADGASATGAGAHER